MNKAYTDNQLIERFKSLPSYNAAKGIPHNLVIGVRSAEDIADAFDDKIYVYVDGKFQLVANCTTNPGKSVLLGGWKSYSKLGAAIVKADEIYYDAYKKSNGKDIPHHKYKMQCLSQVKPIKYYRDGDNDAKTEEIGSVYFANYATNIHFNNYDLWTKIKGLFVGAWSAGCQVLNEADKYRKMLEVIDNDFVTYCLLKEF